jgi:hypothetical protein
MRLPTPGCLVADHCRDRAVAARVGEMMGELVMEALATLDQVAFIRSATVYRNFREAKDFGEFVGQITADDDWRIVSQLVPPLEGRVADTEWKPLPAGLWTPPAVFMEAENLLLEAFMEAGVPTWKVREKTSDPLKWNMIAEGTADSFEAAKAAALYEAGTALRKP